MQVERTIIELLEPKLGIAKRSYSQIKFDCPKCDAGHKKNLEINVDFSSTKHLIFHCWSCGYKGFITKLFKDYAINDSWEGMKEFHSVNVDHIRKKLSQKQYSVDLPDKLIPFYLNKNVENYLLNERKMNKQWLMNRKCMYCFEEPTDEDKKTLKNCIIFPFYNLDDTLVGYCCHNIITKKYKNIGIKNYVPYETFINSNLPVTLTEGVYDSGSIPNAIPLLNTDIQKEVLEFCTNKNVILALDKEVNEYLIEKHIKSLKFHAVKNIYIFENQYKDLNEFLQRDEKSLKNKFYNIYQEFKNEGQ